MQKIRFILLVCFAAILSSIAHTQTKPLKLPTGARKDKDTLQLSEISVRSVEVSTQIRQEFHNLVPSQTIRKLRMRTDEVLSSIDTSLLRPVVPDDPAVNIRMLENRKTLLIQDQRKVKLQENQVSEVAGTFDQLKNHIKHELDLWKRAKDRLLADSLVKILPGKICTTIAFLDSSLNVLDNKSNSIIELLDRIIAVEIRIDLALENTNANIIKKQANALVIDQLPIFSLDPRHDFKDELTNSLSNLTTVKLKELAGYLSSHLLSVILLLTFFGALIWFFIYLRGKIHLNMEGFGRFYKEMLVLVLSRPVLAALILSMFSTGIFFTDRPIIFREFSAYIIAYPLIGILNRIFSRRYRRYIYTFSVVIVLYMLLVLFPADTTIYRLLLLFIALAEIALFSLLLIHFRKHPVSVDYRNKLVLAFILLHLLISATGLFANLSGRIVLTEITINAAFVNILNGVSLFISVIILNGLIAAGIDSARGQKINSFRKHRELIKHRLILTLNILALSSWMINILKSFRLYDLIFKLIGNFFSYKITIGTASFSLDMVVVFFTVIFISYMLARLIQVVLEHDILDRLPLSKGLPHTIATGLKYVLIVSGFLLAFNATGIPMDKITIILGAFSVGIGFGLQNIFSNMVSGLILLFERPIQLGDTVQVGQLIGNVKSIDLRSSNIHTFEGAEVIVPNSQLIANEVINWTLSDNRRRTEVEVGVGYESDPRFVEGLFQELLRNNPSVLQDPPPVVFFTGLGDSSLNFSLVFWVSDYTTGRRTKSDVLFSVFEILQKNNINIPFPQRDIHIRTNEKGGG